MAKLCWIATLIGVFSLILVSSIMNGFNRSIKGKLLSVEPHLTVTSNSDNIQQIEAFFSRQKNLKHNRFTKQDVIIRTLDGRFAGAIAKGLSQDSVYNFVNETHKIKYKNKSAQDVDLEETLLGPQELLMGTDLARDLNLFEGDEVLVIPPEFLLGPKSEVARYERMKIKTMFSTDISDLDAKLIVHVSGENKLRFQSLLSGEEGVEVFMDDPSQYLQLKNNILELFQNEEGIRVESWVDRNKALFLALRLEKAAMTTFLGLSILITCFSLITVLTMLISQKRKDVGLLMSVGLSKVKASKLFLMLGLFLSGFGLFSGLGFGLVASFLLEKYPLEILPDIYFDSSVPSEVSYVFVGGVTVFCFVIAFLAAYVPVRLYMKNSPAENLRMHMARD